MTAPPIAVVGKTAVTVCADCDQQVVRVAVTAREDLKSPPSLVIDSVEFRGAYDATAAAALTASWILSGGRPIALLLTAKPHLDRAGTYEVSVGVISTDPAERQAVTLSITRPAGSVR